MAAFSTTPDSMKRKITLIQAACRGYLVRKKIGLVKTLYRGIVEDLEGKDSANELQWMVHHRLAVPVHEQKESEIDVILKRLSERESSHLPKTDEEKKNSYSSDSFESESSSDRSSTRVRSDTSAEDETGSARSEVSLKQEVAALPEDSHHESDKSVGEADSGSDTSSKSMNSDRDKTGSDSVSDSQPQNRLESGKGSVNVQTVENITEQAKTVTGNCGLDGQEVVGRIQKVSDSSGQAKSQENPSHIETQVADVLNGLSSMNIERSAVTFDNVSQMDSGEKDDREKTRKDEEIVEMRRNEVGRKEVQEERLTDQKGEMEANFARKKSDNDIVRNRRELEKDDILSGATIGPLRDQLSETENKRDDLERNKGSSRETASSRNDDAHNSRSRREENEGSLTRGKMAASKLEAESVARNLEKEFQSNDLQDEEGNDGANELGREEERRRHITMDMKDDDGVGDDDGISFIIPPSPILPQGISKKDNLVSSPLSLPSSSSPSDIPEQLVGDEKGMRNGQNDCDAESTVLTKVTNMTLYSMLNDDTSMWNSEDESPSDPSSLPESLTELQDLRKNIAMELLWVQQAIQSRKAYLQLKESFGSQAGD